MGNHEFDFEMAIKHNQQIPHNHFRKDWQRRVRVHFDQHGRKLRRRNARLSKAAAVTLLTTSLHLLNLDHILDGQEAALERCHRATLTRLLDILSRRIALLGLAAAAWEHNHTLGVLLQTLDVGLEALFGQILAARIDADADGGGVLAGDTGGLQLSEGETTAGADAAVVLDGWAVDDGSQPIGGTGSKLRSLRDTLVTAALLLASLIKVHAHVALPILAEVVFQRLLVVLDGHLDV